MLAPRLAHITTYVLNCWWLEGHDIKEQEKQKGGAFVHTGGTHRRTAYSDPHKGWRKSAGQIGLKPDDPAEELEINPTYETRTTGEYSDAHWTRFVGARKALPDYFNQWQPHLNYETKKRISRIERRKEFGALDLFQQHLQDVEECVRRSRNNQIEDCHELRLKTIEMKKKTRFQKVRQRSLGQKSPASTGKIILLVQIA